MSQREARIVRALAEAIFPSEGTGMPSVDDAGVVGYFDSLLVRLALKEKFLVRGLLGLLEVQCLAFNGLRPRLFTQATLEERITNLSGWEKSNIFHRRLVFMAIRTLLLWAYVDSQEVENGVGFEAGTHATARFYDDDEKSFTTGIEAAAERARQLFSNLPLSHLRTNDSTDKKTA